MSVRQFLFCVFLGAPLLLTTGIMLLLYPLAVAIIALVGERQPFREAWDMLTEAPIELLKSGYHGN